MAMTKKSRGRSSTAGAAEAAALAGAALSGLLAALLVEPHEVQAFASAND